MKKLILSLFLALLVFGGCKTLEVIKYVPINNTITKIDSFTVLRTDSFIQTSKGDTIFRDRWKTIFSDRIKLRIDTVKIPYEVRIDVPVEKQVIKYKHDTVWWIGICFIVGLLLFGLYKIIK